MAENLPEVKAQISKSAAGKELVKGIEKLPEEQQAEILVNKFREGPVGRSNLNKLVKYQENIPVRKAELVGQRGSVLIPPEAGKPIEAAGETAANVGGELLKTPEVIPGVMAGGTAQPPQEPPTAVSGAPSPGEPPMPQKQTRGFIQSVLESSTADPVLKSIISSQYIPTTHEMTKAEAEYLIKTDPNAAYAFAMSTAKPSAVSNTVAMMLSHQAQASGNMDFARAIVEHVAEVNTRNGQAIEALKMWDTLGPEGIVKYADRIIRQARAKMNQYKVDAFNKAVTGIEDDVQREMVARKMKIPYINNRILEEIYQDSVKIHNMPEGREKTVATALMLKKITMNIPSPFLKKISMAQTLAQLLNPVTVIRNLGGNLGMMNAENVARTVATQLDIMASLFTGERTTALPNVKAQALGFIQGTQEGWQEALLGIDTRSLRNKFSLPRNGVFHKGVGAGLEKALAIVLQVPDRAFFQSAFVNSLTEQMRLAKTDVATPEILEQAIFEGLYNTFQDSSAIAKGLVQLKQFFNANQDWGMGDMVIKYPNTPGNILSRGLEYTPIGFARSMYHLGKLVRGYEKTHSQREFVRSFGRAFTGSALLIGGAFILAKLGIISGKRDPNKNVAEAERSLGLREYQINVSALKRFIMSGMDPNVTRPEKDDLLVTYDWALPVSIPLVIGANIVEDAKRNQIKGGANYAMGTAEAMANVSETIVSQPMLSGINRVRHTTSIYDYFMQMVSDVPASMMPTLMAQVTKLTDNIVRNTYDPDYFQQAYNKMAAKVPGLSQQVPERLNVWGQPMKKYPGNTNSIFNIFFNPAFVATYKPMPEAQLVLDIWAQTGEAGVFPKVAPKKVTVNGKSYTLTAESYHDYQQYIGNKTGVLFNMLVNDPYFMRLPNDLKARKLENYLRDINTAAKIEILNIYPEKPRTGQPYVPGRLVPFLNPRR